ncbi:MAG: V-type ATP synthase subunit F [Thermodesulfobacteriota bacterium]
MTGLIIITRPGVSLGFRLGGFECREERGEDVSAVLEEVEREGRYGLVIMDEELKARVSKPLMRRINRKGLPVVVPVYIPEAWEERGEAESPAVRLIRRAIGYQIKIKR